MKPIIFDVDGVLASFTFGYRRLAKEIARETSDAIANGIEVFGPERQKTWDEDEGFPPGLDKLTWKAIIRSDIYWYMLPPLVEKNTFHRINLLDRDVYFVTNRVGIDAKTQTEAWLEDHNIFKPTVIVSGRKGEIASALRVEYLIDDKAGNVIASSWLSEAKCYVLDRPYNQFDPAVAGSKTRRVYSVDDFLNDVEEGK